MRCEDVVLPHMPFLGYCNIKRVHQVLQKTATNNPTNTKRIITKLSSFTETLYILLALMRNRIVENKIRKYENIR